MKVKYLGKEPPNPVDACRATTWPNINNPLKSKVKGHQKREKYAS